MPLTETQKLEFRTILQVDPVYLGDLNSYLNSTTEAQEELLVELLQEWQSVKFKVGELAGEFKSRDSDKQALIRQRLIDILGFYLPNTGFTVGRG